MCSTIAERFLMARGKMKQADFAKALGITPNSLRNYESGRVSPNHKVLERLCVQFSLSPAWLLLGQGPMRIIDETPPPDSQLYPTADMSWPSSQKLGLAEPPAEYSAGESSTEQRLRSLEEQLAWAREAVTAYKTLLASRKVTGEPVDMPLASAAHGSVAGEL